MLAFLKLLGFITTSSVRPCFPPMYLMSGVLCFYILRSLLWVVWWPCFPPSTECTPTSWWGWLFGWRTLTKHLGYEWQLESSFWVLFMYLHWQIPLKGFSVIGVYWRILYFSSPDTSWMSWLKLRGCTSRSCRASWRCVCYFNWLSRDMWNAAS